LSVFLLTSAAVMAAPTNIVPMGAGSQLTWQPVTSFNGDPAQISTAGVHHAAVRFGNADLVINGVTFSRHTGSGNFANGAPITSTAPTVESRATGGTGNYGALVSSGGFHSDTVSPNLTISGLTVGRRYQVQLIMPYWNELWLTQVGAAGGATVTVATGVSGFMSPSLCTGSFRATASNQVLTWSVSPGNGSALLAGVSVRLLPDENVMTIAENNAPGAAVDTLWTVDANAGATHGLSLVSGTGSTDNASFTIEGNTLKLLASADYETKTSYSIRVQADDGSGGLFSKAFTVNVTNVIEYPEIVVEQPSATDLTSGTASVSFGYEPLGTPGVVKTFTIRNTGLAPLTLSNPSVSGGNASDFTVNTTGLLLTVPPGGQTTFAVNFTPSASGSRSTTLGIGNNDTDESPFTITLTGNGAGSLPTGPEIGIELGGIDLSSQVVAWGRYNTTPADLTNARMVSGGGEHSLALKSDGTVVAWGRNTEGQATVPAGLSGVMAVAAGAYHSLALKADGTVVMWGDDNHGAYAVPAGLTNVKQIATGYDHSLALKQDGTVVAWGYNFDGQATVPSGLSNVIAIAAGSSHSLALKSDGTVVGWGTPTGGQSTPPAGLTGVVAIAAGVHHSLALKSDGTVVAWGTNSAGQMTIPAGLSGVVAIAAGASHSVAMKNNGTLVTWGDNTYQQTEVPTTVGTVTKVEAGSHHTLAIGCSGVAFGAQQRGVQSPAKIFTLRNTGTADLVLATATVSGNNAADFSVDLTGMAGTLAPGSSTTFSVRCTPSALGERTTTLLVVNSDSDEYYTQIPLTATGITQAPTLINPMYAHVTAHTVDLGANVIGDDGEPITERGVVLSVTASNNNPVIGGPGVRTIPTTGTLGAFWMPVDSLAASTSYTFKVYATNNSGTSYTSARTFTTPAANGRIEMISTDGRPYGGTVLTWGDHSFGQLSGSPHDPNIIAITSGAVHAAALRRDGTVHAWGDNSYAGQTNVPAGLSNVIAISAGDYFTLALKSDGTVVRWGKESDPGLTPPAGLSGVIAIAAGAGHGLALKSDGTVVQWPTSSGVPANLSGVVGIAAGLGHSLAVLGDGTVVGWGNNNGGQATPPAGLVDVIAVAARGTSSLALQRNGYIAAWGSNAGIPGGVSNVAGLGTGDGANMVYTRTGGFIGWGDNSDGKITPPAGLSHVIGVAGGSYHTSVMRREMAFGSIGIGSDHTIQFRLRNRGDNPLSIQQIVIQGDHVADFTVNQAIGSNVPAGAQSGLVEVTFAPLATGSRQAVLRIQTNDPEIPNFDILVTGAGILQAPLISDPTLTNLSHHSVVLGARVTHEGGSAITQRGVVLSLSSRNANPTLGGTGVMTLTTSGSLGVFTLPASSLLMNREYVMRGFASNVAGTHYTDEITFTTPQTALPDIQIEQPAGTPVSSPVVGRGDYGSTPALPGITSLTSGGQFNLALTQDGKIIGWGDNSQAQLDFPEEMTDVVAVSAGSGHALALNRNGSVFASGGYFEFPNFVPGTIGNDVVAIHAAWLHNMVLHRNGTVSAWEGGWYGPGQSTWLTPPEGLTDVIAITGGSGFCVALKADGTVVTWGNSFAQQFIEPPAGLNNVRAVAAGLAHTLALKNDGTVVAWGYNQSGQTDVPSGLNDVVAIFAGYDYSLARRSDGTIVAWGPPGRTHTDIPSDHPGYQWMSGGFNHTYTVDTMIDFGDASLGSVTATKTFTLRNTGDADLHLSEISIVGTNDSDFIVTPPGTTTIAPGATTTVNVIFVPSAVGYRSASLRINSDDFNEGSLDITLKGNGVIGAPNVLTQLSNSVTKTSATLGGIVTSDGGDAITERGIVFAASSTNADPLIGGTGVTKLSTTGTFGPFSFNVTDLTPNTAYSWKAYATNTMGTSYSNLATFTTKPEPLVGVGNLVFWDKNANGRADAGEGIDGVTVQLFTSTQDPLVNTPLQSTTTANGGLWLIDQLHEGGYRLFIPPAMFASGAPLDHLKSIAGASPSGDDDLGEKGLDALTPASHGVRTDIVTLVAGSLPAGDQELGRQGGSDDARDASVDLTQDFGFVDVTDLPATFTQWKQQRGITGQGNGNHDHDAHDDLFEYALGTPASDDTPRFSVDDQPQNGRTHIVLRRRRGSQSDIVFKVQVCPDLSGSQGGWTATTITPTITNNSDGTETLTFPDVTTDPALSGSPFGFTRLIIELDADQNGTPELTTSSDILGWQHRPLTLLNQTYGLAFVRPAVFTAIADGISGSTLDLSTAAGSTDLRTLFVAGEQYYAEVIAGDNEGHRYEVDEAASSPGTLSLLLNDSLSTQTTLSPDLAGDTLALRPHWRVKDLFPPARHTPGTSAANSDQLQLWDATQAKFLPLLLGTHPTQGRMWVFVGGTSSQNNRIIPPADGLFVKPNQALIAAANGQVRTWKFACPLRLGTNLIGNPYPVSQSFTSRLMTFASGFTGHFSANSADRVNAWSGDTSGVITPGYVPYMLSPTGTWVKVGEVPSVNRSSDPVFAPGTAAFITSRTANPLWIMPAAVAP